MQWEWKWWVAFYSSLLQSWCTPSAIFFPFHWLDWKQSGTRHRGWEPACYIHKLDGILVKRDLFLILSLQDLFITVANDIPSLYRNMCLVYSSTLYQYTILICTIILILYCIVLYYNTVYGKPCSLYWSESVHLVVAQGGVAANKKSRV